MALVTLLYALFASVFVIAKEGLLHSSPFFLVGSRMLLASVILFAYLAFTRGRKVFTLTPHVLWLMFLLGLTNIYMTNAFEFWGLQFLSPAKTCFIYSLSPFISALFSYLLLSETLTPKKWAGLIVGFLGFVPVFLGQGADEAASGHLWVISWAELSVLVAATATVVGWIIMRKLIHETGNCYIVANAWSMLLGGLMATGHSLLAEEWNPVPVTNFWPYFEATLLMILISSLICYNLYGYLLRSFTATFLSFAGFMTPIFTAVFEWLWFGDLVSMEFIISAVIVLFGLVLFYQEELKKEGIHTEAGAS